MKSIVVFYGAALAWLPSSFRVRKKARYQELLDKEVELETLRGLEDLKRARSRTLQKFLSMRQEMFLKMRDVHSSDHGLSNMGVNECLRKHYETLIERSQKQRILESAPTFSFENQTGLLSMTNKAEDSISCATASSRGPTKTTMTVRRDDIIPFAGRVHHRVQ